MGRNTPRRRKAKRLSGRSASSERRVPNKTFRFMNRFGKRAQFLFLGALVLGWMLISPPPIQVTISDQTVYAFGGVLSGAAVGASRMRRRQR
ncbi:hypothetical protein [Streptomyces sp. NPDC058861]|uniref:hypothetical protein n=1 Tax=Streptomyces sp. NPDC058861 TaxID=3346653 RepID=UPI0036882A21